MGVPHARPAPVLNRTRRSLFGLSGDWGSYDDGALLSRGSSRRPESHNKHTFKLVHIMGVTSAVQAEIIPTDAEALGRDPGHPALTR